ncbi:hypothetical protein HMPREF0578_1222 [Mobiluncus mulieris 28-1]|nr:hypothetical protein HMPREF0578_1222 [Mobiluncus mulieris 28-1]
MPAGTAPGANSIDLMRRFTPGKIWNNKIVKIISPRRPFCSTIPLKF